MSQNLDLKAIERKAFRSVHQDGLWDLYLGGLMLAIYPLFSIITDDRDLPLTTLLPAFLGVGLPLAIYHLGKRYVTLPRMGQVRFGPERRKRRLTLAWIMGIFVLFTLGLVLFSLYVWNFADPASLGGTDVNPGMGRLLVATISALLAGASTLTISYFREFTRGYYIALLMGASFFFALLLNNPIPVGIAGLLILLPGLVLFFNFLRRHPLPPGEVDS